MKDEHMAAQVAFEGIAALMAQVELLYEVHPSCHDKHYYAGVRLVSGDWLRIVIDGEERAIQWMRVPEGRWSGDALREWPLEQWLRACEVVIKDHLEQEEERAQVAWRRCVKMGAWLEEMK